MPIKDIHGHTLSGADDLAARHYEAACAQLRCYVDDPLAEAQAALAQAPDMTMKVSQGVTSVVVGNCGISLAPLATASPPPPPLTVLFNAKDFVFPTMRHYLDRLAVRAQGGDPGPDPWADQRVPSFV